MKYRKNGKKVKMLYLEVRIELPVYPSFKTRGPNLRIGSDQRRDTGHNLPKQGIFILTANRYREGTMRFLECEVLT